MLSSLRHSRIFLRTALLVLLAMAAPTLAMLAQPAMAAMPMDGMHHCSAMASKSTPTQKAPEQKSQCAVCQTLHVLGGGFTAPKPVTLGHVIRTGIVIRQAGNDAALLQHWLSPHIQPRAPPFSA
jgi:hypothetical protein